MKHLSYLFIFAALLLLTACPTVPPPVSPGQPELSGQPALVSEQGSSFSMRNIGGTALEWQILISNDPSNPQPGNWFTVSPSSGRLAPSESVGVSLSLNSAFRAGSYKARISVAYAGGSQQFEVRGQIKSDEPEVGSFSLSSDGISNAIVPGAPLQIPIFITRDKFDAAVTLELFGIPEGLSGSFVPNPALGDEAALMLESDGNVASGSYVFSVRGRANGQSSSLDITVGVTGNQQDEPDFNLALSTASILLSPGETRSLSLDVRRRGDFAEDISLSVIDLPTGLSAAFVPNPASDSSSLTLTAAATMAVGSYELVIQGEAGGLSRSIRLGVSIRSSDSSPGRISGRVSTENSLIPLQASQTSPPQMSQGMGAQTFVPGQLLVQYRDGSDAFTLLQRDKPMLIEQRQLVAESVQQRYGLQVLSQGLPGQADLVALPAGTDVLEAAQRLARDSMVKFAEPNYYLHSLGIPNDPLISQQWALAALGLPVAWTAETGSSNRVIVAVLDSGFGMQHPDLASRYLPGYDFCAVSSGDCNGQTDSNPGHGTSGNIHGTHVAGIIGAIGNNGQGISGVAYGTQLRILPVKMFNDQGSGATVSSFVNSIRWAVGLPVSGVPNNPNKAQIVNLSLGGFFESDILQTAVTDARNAGALIVAATGNNGLDRIMVPAALDGVIAVGSINSQFRRSCFSNYGSSSTYGPGSLDLVAPGGDGRARPSGIAAVPSCSPPDEAILSTLPGGTYGQQAGTSMATPYVAGVAALILSQNPALSVQQLEQRLLASTFYNGSTMNRAEYGAGILRADLALGLPGPGSQVTVIADGPGTAVDTVTLDLRGSSSTFNLRNLAAGNYTVEAISNGSRGSLQATQAVTLSSGQSRNITLELTP